MPAGRVSEATRLQIQNRDPVRGRDIPGFAANPADPDHVVLITEEFITGPCYYHISFDGGRTWESGGHLAVPTDFADPSCATYDSGGYAHFNKSVVWGTGRNVYTTFASHRGPKQRPETGTAQGEGDSANQPFHRRRSHVRAGRRRHPKGPGTRVRSSSALASPSSPGPEATSSTWSAGT